jgi:hypothetical protein
MHRGHTAEKIGWDSERISVVLHADSALCAAVGQKCVPPSAELYPRVSDDIWLKNAVVLLYGVCGL